MLVEEIAWFAAPIVFGVITGWIIARAMRNRWKDRIDRAQKQEKEMQDLIASE
jgi:uncharacterized membrane-anchored protein YhcB (DUF1043 family)